MKNGRKSQTIFSRFLSHFSNHLVEVLFYLSKTLITQVMLQLTRIFFRNFRAYTEMFQHLAQHRMPLIDMNRNIISKSEAKRS